MFFWYQYAHSRVLFCLIVILPECCLKCLWCIFVCLLIKGWCIWTSGQFSSTGDADGNSLVALWARRETGSSNCSQESPLQAAWSGEHCYTDGIKQKGVRHSTKSYPCRRVLSRGKKLVISQSLYSIASS